MSFVLVMWICEEEVLDILDYKVSAVWTNRCFGMSYAEQVMVERDMASS